MSNLAEVKSIDPDAEIEAEIKELRERREAIERARQERFEREEPQRRKAAELLALKDAEAIAEAEAKVDNPKKLGIVRTDLGVVIVRRSHPARFKKFQDTGRTTTKELEELVRPCIVYPSISEFEAIVQELPATLLRVADAISTLAGVRAEELAVKS